MTLRTLPELVLAVCLFLGNEAQSQTGIYAVARPLHDITIDGDLDDWPDGLTSYPVRLLANSEWSSLAGEDLDLSDDLSPSFRLGWEPDEGLLFIALAVTDDSLALGDDGDRCEIYLANPSGGEPTWVISSQGESPKLVRGIKGPLDHLLGRQAFNESGWNVGQQTVGEVTVYEVAIPLADLLTEANSVREGWWLRWDVVVIDVDDNPPGSQVWWSAGHPKDRSGASLGWVLLSRGEADLAAIRTTYTSFDSSRRRLSVRASAGDGRFVVAEDPATGTTVWLLPGQYELTASGVPNAKRITVDVAAGDSAQVDLGDFVQDARLPVKHLKMHSKASYGHFFMSLTPGLRGVHLPGQRARYQLFHSSSSDSVSKSELSQDWAEDFDPEVLVSFEDGYTLHSAFDMHVDRSLFGRPVVLSGRGLKTDMGDTVRVLLNDQEVMVNQGTGAALPGISGVFSLGMSSQQGLTVEVSSPNGDRWRYLDLWLTEPDGVIASEAEDMRDGVAFLILLIVVPALFALIHLLLFAYYPPAVQNLFFGIGAVLAASLGLSFNSELAAQLFGVPGLRAWLGLPGLPSLMLIFPVILRFIYAVFLERPRVVVYLLSLLAVHGVVRYWGGAMLDAWRPWPALVAALVITGAGILYLRRSSRSWPRWLWAAWLVSPLTYLPADQAALTFMIILVVSLADGVRTLAQAVWRRAEGALLLAGGVVVVPVSLVAAMSIDVFLPDSVVPYYVAYAGVLLFTGSLSAHLAKQFGRTNRALDERVSEVQRLSEANLAQERALRTRLERELGEARKLQISMLPRHRPEMPGTAVAWQMQTATEVGGDYYDYSLADDGTFTMCIGDATGHGMDSGVVVTATKSLFQTFADAPSIADSLKVMSKSLRGMNLPRMGMAMAFLRLQDSTMTVSSAGMPPLMVYRAGTGEVEEVKVSGYPLGLSATAQYEEETFEVSPEDVILMMSDGLPERLNPEEEYFDYDRTRELFGRVASGTPEEIVAAMLQGGNEWAEGRPMDDDITLVVLKAK
jgi:serine phosphatase RsbU (regulator of sigma subunit)